MEISTVIRFVFACMENTMLLAVHFKVMKALKNLIVFQKENFQFKMSRRIQSSTIIRFIFA